MNDIVDEPVPPDPPADPPEADFYITGDKAYNEWRLDDHPGAVANASYDLSGAVFHFRHNEADHPTVKDPCSSEPMNKYPLIAEHLDNVEIRRPLVLGEASLTALWGYMYGVAGTGCNSAAVRLGSDPDFGYVLDGARITRAWDGIRTPMWNGGSFTIRNTWVSNVRDDCIENDADVPGLIEDSLIEGCSNFLSTRSNSTKDNSAHVITIRDMLVHQAVYWQSERDLSNQHYSTGNAYKTDSTAPSIAIDGLIWAFEGVLNGTYSSQANNIGWLIGDPGIDPDFGDKLESCTGTNKLLWLPDNNPPQILTEYNPACFTLETGATAQATWDAARCAWIAAHQEPITRWIDAGETNSYNPTPDALCD